MSFYTYMWLREDGTPYYVGKGMGRRAYRKGSPPRVRILIEEHGSELDALQAEKLLISIYGRKDRGTGCLRNRTNGGDGISGYQFSLEEKARISRSLANNQNAALRNLQQKAVELRKQQRLGLKNIAKELGVSVAICSSWLREYPLSAAEITSRKREAVINRWREQKQRA